MTRPTPDRFPLGVRLCHAAGVPGASQPATTLRVVVVGGGIAGLAAAHRLAQRCPGAEIIVLEASAARRRQPALGRGRRGRRRHRRGGAAQPPARGRRPGPRGRASVTTWSTRRPPRRALVPRPAAAAAAHVMGVPLDLRAARRRPVRQGARPRRAGHACCPATGWATATSASATWWSSGWARRSSTGWWSRCWAGSTPATPASSPPGPPYRSWWRCSSATAR